MEIFATGFLVSVQRYRRVRRDRKKTGRFPGDSMVIAVSFPMSATDRYRQFVDGLLGGIRRSKRHLAGDSVAKTHVGFRVSATNVREAVHL